MSELQNHSAVRSQNDASVLLPVFAYSSQNLIFAVFRRVGIGLSGQVRQHQAPITAFPVIAVESEYRGFGGDISGQSADKSICFFPLVQEYR